MQNVSDRFQRHHQHNAFFYQLKGLGAVSGEGVKKVSSAEALERSAVTIRNEKIRKNVEKPKSKPKGTTTRKKKLIQRDPEQLYQEAVKAFDHERFIESARLFDLLLEQQPTNPKALVGKGLLQANQGKYRDARISCAQAIKEDDLLPEAYLLRGLILDMEGFLERALMEYQKVLWLDSAFVMAHYLSAKIHDRLAEDEKKQRSLRNTIRVLEQLEGQADIPFSGGLSRGVFLEIVRGELAESS
jgi:chemotaxis protein methyltransferase CheR